MKGTGTITAITAPIADRFGARHHSPVAPADAPLGERIMVLTPMTRPALSING
eukprot:COSAG02_NODE_19483_length_879_cov_1.967949_1_plen_52_part_01